VVRFIKNTLIATTLSQLPHLVHLCLETRPHTPLRQYLQHPTVAVCELTPTQETCTHHPRQAAPTPTYATALVHVARPTLRLKGTVVALATSTVLHQEGLRRRITLDRARLPLRGTRTRLAQLSTRSGTESMWTASGESVKRVTTRSTAKGGVILAVWG
jgi:hypothetical protein